jgi:arginine N-succinyltransferase
MSKFTQIGLTTLPHDKKILCNRILESLHSFSSDLDKPKGDPYLFVLEDISTHAVIGICGVLSKIGGFEPFYTYEIKTILKKSRHLNVKNEITYLRLLRVHNGPSEAGTLFLMPQARQNGAGRLLSLSRFLFIAQYRKRFEKRIVAEMRGYFDNNGKSPFWESVSRYFFPVEFEIADLMQMKDKSFIEDLIPEHPLYVALLPYAAQKVIGKIYKDTEPALHILEREGFKRTNEVSIFDAGPVVSAKVDEIRSVKDSRVAEIAGFVDSINSKNLYLIANVQSISHFRVAIGQLRKLRNQSIRVTKEVGSALCLKTSDQVRYVPLRPPYSRKMALSNDDEKN